MARRIPRFGAWPRDAARLALISWLALAGSGILAGERKGEEETLPWGEGWVFVFHSNKLKTAFGPAYPGETVWYGDLVPGALKGAEAQLLARQLPSALNRPPALSRMERVRDHFLVVLDPGHGGNHWGAVGGSGLLEKNLVLEVAERARVNLQRVPNLEVVMTRVDDTLIPLPDRTLIANQLDADLFVSIHANAYTDLSFFGVETFFHAVNASGAEARRVATAENTGGKGSARESQSNPLKFILEDMKKVETLEESSRFAYLVQDELARVLPFQNQGVMQADFEVLRETRMPSVLIELGYLTQPLEEKVLRKREVQESIAQAIQRAVVDYWESLKRKNLRSLAEVPRR